MVLEMIAINKSFQSVKALNNVNMNLLKGEVHALVGENGAGKSTLMKILAGIYQPDEGEIRLNGKQVALSSPTVSQNYGISIIHQELNLIPHMTVTENIFLGREPKKLGVFSNIQQMKKETEKLLERFDLKLDPDAMIASLSIGEQQIVEIAKAISMNAEILIMDEPTAVLEEREVQKLFDLIQQFKTQGVSIIYISHRLNELKHFCDRLTVLRDGQFVQTLPMDGLTEKEIASLMVGRELNELYPVIRHSIGEEILRVEGLTRKPNFENVSFSVKRGEIIGFAGLIGAGRTELVRTIFGDWRADKGTIFWKGKQTEFRSPVDAVLAGIGFATEDRKHTGLFLDMSVSENISVTCTRKVSKWNFIRKRSEGKLVQKKIAQLNVKVNKITSPVKNLSGGNQQKVVLAKWIAADSELFILDEPTRGIDVGAKGEIYELISQLAAEGKAVIIVSSELPELLGICNRILVMHHGQIKGELDHSIANEQNVMALAAGV
ncbi:MAG: sugar ABC transporter ATP-binding protein [Candidatus Pristimantibacillus lignocellulolyticus]|uniref:Sugar ABC transporter ATP-binding protein n=1 Tax=Candidatus Pristimantibacillus lignocellulolyticus TaxID=2994561 RepID=A0A9J6ZED7_9BACL|nr:MAG: sugar ABC transporter ATP-binding protein [Candidatus Pristimantibacillus lignocellulolyticus]